MKAMQISGEERNVKALEQENAVHILETERWSV